MANKTDSKQLNRLAQTAIVTTSFGLGLSLFIGAVVLVFINPFLLMEIVMFAILAVAGLLAAGVVLMFVLMGCAFVAATATQLVASACGKEHPKWTNEIFN